jgi:hypothetical protein
MVPLLLAGLNMGLLGGVGQRETWADGGPELILAIVFLVIATGMTLLPIAILYRTTMGYLNASPMDGGTVEDTDDADGSLKCLACGTIIPADVNNCPSCGWSFESEV